MKNCAQLVQSMSFAKSGSGLPASAYSACVGPNRSTNTTPFAFATSAIASTQTTIIPASRTGLSMARRHALPSSFARIHPTHRTPDVSTWWVAGIAIVWYVAIYQVSANALFDSLTALALLIAFYYALTGIACAVYHRKHLTESVKNLLLIGVGPLIGSGLLLWLLVLAIGDMADPENSYSGQSWLGVGPPLVIGVGILLVGCGSAVADPAAASLVPRAVASAESAKAFSWLVTFRSSGFVLGTALGGVLVMSIGAQRTMRLAQQLYEEGVINQLMWT